MASCLLAKFSLVFRGVSISAHIRTIRETLNKLAGMFQTLSVAYASEVCPVVLRGYLTTYANICWVIGQVLSSGVLDGFLSSSGEWAYRIPFALQWIFIPPIAIGVFFAPEVSLRTV